MERNVDSSEAFSQFMTWPGDSQAFYDAIVQNKATLKIVMKMKDEREFLEPWIRWHADICGEENIIILDNISTDPIVADIYRSHPKITICRYSGFLDNVHSREIFAAMYEGLAVAADFYTLIDADEFLTLLSSARHHDRFGVVDFLRAHEQAEVFPGIWLHNQPGSATRFELGGACGNIRGGLLWGKPITRPTTRLFPGTILHNSSAFAPQDGGAVPNNIFVLHLSRMYPERRIRSNVNKLIHHRVLAPGATLTDALAISETTQMNRHARNILKETQWLVANPTAWEPIDGALPVGVAELRDDGSVVHSTADQREIFQRFLDDNGAFYRTLLASKTNA